MIQYDFEKAYINADLDTVTGYCQQMGATYTPDMPPKATPMAYGAVLDPDSPQGNKQLYAEMVGTLLFAAVSTRPDIACAVSMESRFMSNPSKAHLYIRPQHHQLCFVNCKLWHHVSSIIFYQDRSIL